MAPWERAEDEESLQKDTEEPAYDPDEQALAGRIEILKGWLPVETKDETSSKDPHEQPTSKLGLVQQEEILLEALLAKVTG